MFKVGDRVRVKRSVNNPRHGWGAASHKSVGPVHSANLTLVVVDFPEDTLWWAMPEELELVEEKQLPKYEYKYNLDEGDCVTPNDVAKYGPAHCDDFKRELGAFCLWYARGDQGSVNNAGTVAALVADGRFLWLDWLAENTPMVEKIEIKSEEDVWLRSWWRCATQGETGGMPQDAVGVSPKQREGHSLFFGGKRFFPHRLRRQNHH